MKKITLIVSILITVAALFGQNKYMTSINLDKPESKKSDLQSNKSVPIWEVTFEEEIPVWTFGSITGTKTWAVSDTTPTNGYTYMGAPVPPLWIYMGEVYVNSFSDSGGNFAYIDGISDLLGLFPVAISESYIQFDNIDLSVSEHPKLVFYQNYKKFNFDECYLDFSPDGGVTWTSLAVNDALEWNSFGETFCEIVAPLTLAGSANVSIRFRWNCPNADPQYGMGYGWEIDDIAFVDNPDYELRVIDGRVNFFQYIDYTQPDYEQYFHSSSHYGQIPVDQFESENALIWFNVMVKNMGNLDANPVVNVTVYDPSMNEIFNYSSTTETEVLSVNQTDTVDMINVDFYPGPNPPIGLYTIVFSVSVDGQIDGIPENNTMYSYFSITDDVYSRALNEPDGAKGLCDYSIGGIDGEMMGTTFTFFNGTEITSLDIFIDESTTPMTSFIAEILTYSQENATWVTLYSSSLITIDEGDLGTWMNIGFTDPAIITIPEGEASTEILVALELYYQGSENIIRIGNDYDVRSGAHGAMFYIVDESTWYYGAWTGGGLSMNLNLNSFVLPCPEDTTVCVNDSPFILSDNICYVCYFSGTGVEDNVFYPALAGPGVHTIYHNYYNYQCSFTITVNDIPEHKEIISTPVNGLLNIAETGTIGVTDSDPAIVYFVTKNDIISSAEFLGNGSTLELGSEFTQGTYQVWSRNSTECMTPLGIVTFVENDGTAKIIVSSNYGDPPTLMHGSDVIVSLYKQIDNGGETEIITEAEMIPSEEGHAIFSGLEAGIYYLRSSVTGFAEENVYNSVFYDNVLTFDDASQIVLEDAEVIIISLNHPIIDLIEGTNSGSGTVGDQEKGKSLNPLEGKVVVLRDSDNDEIVDVAITDENGHYEFPAIPDNRNISIFVTMPESPIWTAFNVLIGTFESITVDFIVVGNSVYPVGNTIPQQLFVAQEISIFPNPSTDKIEIKSILPYDEVKIFSTQGKLVLSLKSEGINSVDISSLSQGSYIIVGVDELNKIGIGKFVKN